MRLHDYAPKNIAETAPDGIDYELARLYYDIAGWAGPDHAAEWGADWVRFGLDELSFSQLVFASDYPQAVREPSEVAGYVAAVRALGGNGRALTAGVNAEKLIPDIARRVARPTAASAKVRA